MSAGRGEDWLEELADLVPADPPEPWAATAPDATGLTEEQQAFLDALADTPPVPRLRDDLPHDAVPGGDVPGDEDPGDEPDPPG